MKRTLLLVAAVVALLGACSTQQKKAWAHLDQDTLYVVASQFKAGKEMAALGDSANVIHYVLKERETVPFTQSAVRQSTDEAKQGPVADEPFFTVRFTLPIPASYTPTEQGELK